MKTISLFTLLSVGFFAVNANAFTVNNGACDSIWSNCLVFSTYNEATGEPYATEFFSDSNAAMDQMSGLSGYNTPVNGKIGIPNTNGAEVSVVFESSEGQPNFLLGTVASVTAELHTAFARELILAPGVRESLGETTQSTYRQLDKPATGLNSCWTHTVTITPLTFTNGQQSATVNAVTNVVTSTSLITWGCPN